MYPQRERQQGRREQRGRDYHLGKALQGRSSTQSLVESLAEEFLATRDAILARLIASQSARWPSQPSEDPIWGLVRIVMAQQIATRVACRLAENVKSAYPGLIEPSNSASPDLASLRALGLPERRAQCCLAILERSGEIRAQVDQGRSWAEALAGIKGI